MPPLFLHGLLPCSPCVCTYHGSSVYIVFFSMPPY
jgi:hypothetical protein